MGWNLKWRLRKLREVSLLFITKILNEVYEISFNNFDAFVIFLVSSGAKPTRQPE
jgi:hypothetical protein